jgi:predicted dehydrogenase
MAFKALVIGCGNIGALYDFDNDHILTHAKAYSLHADFEFSIFDPNASLAKKISTAYDCPIISDINASILRGYDCVSICSPTKTHTTLLKQAFEAEIKVIICEKPVSNELTELEELRNLYGLSKSKVIVNYIRRFQPALKALKKTIADISEKDNLTNIAIRYQRGFINNCSHAFDLIEYLTEQPLLLSGIKKHNLVTDHFEEDPTLSLQAFAGTVNVNVLGLSNVQFSHFEIDLYFKQHKISITEAGQTIRLYQATNNNSTTFSPLQQSNIQQDNCLKDYMQPIIDQAGHLLRGRVKEDNFLQATHLNQRMLNYLNN